ncbi:nod factor hydrolase protein 1-like [Tasmannia lanceolata]|uniref:nod factor hydrolase protein 1-like n=1 Tax=Tasmannia lanceolata TaxID=3420 RepID=UPI004064BAC2
MDTNNPTTNSLTMASLKISPLLLLTFFCSTLSMREIPYYSMSPPSSPAGVKGAYWPSYRSEIFPVSSIDTSYFTHIFYAFVLPNPTTYKLTITPQEAAKLRHFSATLHAKNPPIKALVSIGGGGSNSTAFSIMASTATTRHSFIGSTISTARKYGLDGLDLDWEFPKNRQDMENLALLFSEWRAAVNKEARASGRKPLLLTAAVYFAAEFFLTNHQSFPGGTMGESLDFVNAMCYDFHGSWDPSETGSHAALYDPNSNISTSYGIESWIKAGVPSHKILMGLPLYGRSWKLKDPGVHGIGAPAVSVGPGDEGVMIYSEVADFNVANNATVHYDRDTGSTYSYAGTTWIGYDDKISVFHKMSYGQIRDIGGYFFWALGYDKNWTISSKASTAWDFWGIGA